MNGDEATIAMIRALSASGIQYMLVGSFSSNFYGIPRATEDADFVIEFGSETIALLGEKLGEGLRLERQTSFELPTGTVRNCVSVVGSPFKIELFRLSADPHDQERFHRRRAVKILNTETYVPTAEDVIVTKLRWSKKAGRIKDLDDARNVAAVQNDRLDWGYIERWCDQHGTRLLLDGIRGTIPPV